MNVSKIWTYHIYTTGYQGQVQHPSDIRVPLNSVPLTYAADGRCRFQECSGFRFVRVRNPWSQGRWKGDWSDESTLWEDYPEVRTFRMKTCGMFLRSSVCIYSRLLLDGHFHVIDITKSFLSNRPCDVQLLLFPYISMY